MKIKIQQETTIEKDIEFPIYSHRREEYCEVFIRVDEKELRKITIFQHGKVEYFKCEHKGVILEDLVKFTCTESVWEFGLGSMLSFIKL